MDGISDTLAMQQANTQNEFSLIAVKLAAESQQRLVALLGEAVQSGQALASNPPHLGQSLDTFA